MKGFDSDEIYYRLLIENFTERRNLHDTVKGEARGFAS